MVRDFYRTALLYWTDASRGGRRAAHRPVRALGQVAWGARGRFPLSLLADVRVTPVRGGVAEIAGQLRPRVPLGQRHR